MSDRYRDRLVYEALNGMPRVPMAAPRASTAPRQPSDEIGALWEKKAKNGDEYLRGTITMPNGDVMKIVAFRSKSTSGDAPAWRLFEARQP